MKNIKIISANNVDIDFSIRTENDSLVLVLKDIVVTKANTVSSIKPEDVKNINKAVFQFFTENDGCPNEECKKLKKAYKKELEILEQNPATCTSCARGALNRKYIPLIKHYYEQK